MGRPLAKDSKRRILINHLVLYKQAKSRICTIQKHFLNIALLPGTSIKQGINRWNCSEKEIYSILKHQLMVENFKKILNYAEKDLYEALLEDFDIKELTKHYGIGARSVYDRIEAIAEKFVKYKERIYGEQKDIEEFCK